MTKVKQNQACTVIMVFVTPHAHAQQGVKWSSLSFCLSAKNLRWCELATFRTSEHIRRFENAPILPVPATGLTHSHSLGFLLFSYYPVHFVSHFIYGHQSRPQLICHMFTYIHAHAQQLTLHSGCSIWQRWMNRGQCRACGVCALWALVLL